MGNDIRSITEFDIRRGLLCGKVQLVKDTLYGSGDTVCRIGLNTFFFGGMSAEGVAPYEYATFTDLDTAVHDIVETLEDFETEFPDEWAYYRAVLNND